MNIDQAKAISITDILTHLHIEPRRASHHKLLYLSPVREEKTPSFWVDTHTNRWHDFGDGRGGDPIDLVCAYLKFHREDHTVADALRWIKTMGVGPYAMTPVSRERTDDTPDAASLILKTKKPIQHVGLIHYLDKRGIPLSVARQHLNELHVRNQRTNKNFFALGFANKEGGFELRNPFFKGCLGPKTISFIRGSEPKPEGIRSSLFFFFRESISL